ncbi:hypothetical protein ABAZ39_13095 [Azospirillum argentinense]|uniref:ABC transmembrane type-1 domain-containing protein n=1 Tax=Azospirillum argentinense TaxID=2970906 RepID=A0A060DFI6_9PROT|nr:ABC transporter permease [Azospirillum argentinense]AIB12906.1 hypothetical protein ABAZ39_13095 [Azospirillum argentinense]EZQ09648.1 peptide ABC transporter permease [Azospirillum argentinense]
MVGALVRRLLGALVTLAAAAVLAILAFHAAPGDPASALFAGGAAPPEMAERLRDAHGLNRPLAGHLAAAMASLLCGDAGTSLRYWGTPVTAILADAWPVTVALATGALALALPAGAALGLLAARRRGGRGDVLLGAVLTAFLSLPTMAMATALAWLLAVAWPLLPLAGWTGPGSAVLPVLVLAVPATGYLGRVTRALTAEILPQDHVRTARAKGLPEHRVLLGHVLGNAAGPLAAAAGLVYGALLGGSLVVETLFALPGMGRVATEAMLARDYPVALGAVLALTAATTLVTLASDLLAAWLDPRRSLDAGVP